MKVVKCLEHIDKRFWGRIVEDSSDFKPSDTFPLPEQGDEVEVSDNGIKWCGKERWTYNFVSYYASVKSFITIDEAYATATWKYIRPKVSTTSTTWVWDMDGILNEVDKTLSALRDIQKDLHEIFEYLKDN